MKKSFLLLFVMLLTAMSASAYDFVKDGIYYNIISLADKTVEVTSRDGVKARYSGHVNIPSSVTYEGTTYSVTKIGVYAFGGSSGLMSVTIPNSVTYIDQYAFFQCQNLTSMTIPNSVTTIDDAAFLDCSSLTTLILGSGLEFIGDMAFLYCDGLTSVTCLALTAPLLETDQVFGNTTYDNATLIVPTGVITAYQAATYWSQFYHIQEVQYFEKNGIYYHITSSANKTVEVTYRDTNYNSYSGNINIPSTVTINGTTFSVKRIGEFAFADCSGLNAVTVPNSVTSIGASAFRGCSALMNITIPNTITSLVENVFADCSSLTNFVIPSSVTSIGYGTFRGCSGLSNVTLSPSLTNIGTYAFKGCSALASLTIPSSVTNIGNYAFADCNGLTSVTCLAYTPPTMGNNAVFNNATYSSAILFVEKSRLNAYRSAVNWEGFSSCQPTLNYALNVDGGILQFISNGDYPWTNIVEGDRIYAVSGNKGVHNSTSTLTLTTNYTKTQILSFEFKSWGEGTSYDKSVFSIDGIQQFSYGEADNGWTPYSVVLTPGTHTLTWTYSKDGSVSLWGDCFYLDNVKIEEFKEAYACYTPSNTTLTFYYDSQRESRPGTTYDLNTGTGATGWYSDGINSSVTRVVFNSSFANARPTSTAGWFYLMENLQSITGMQYLNTSQVTNMDVMFRGCSSLTSLNVSYFNTANVTDMRFMFDGCSGLTTLNVSSFNTANVTKMNNMFAGCSGLTSLNLSNFNTAKVTSMKWMFRGCNNLTSLNVSSFNTANVTDMNSMFQGCSGLTSLDVSSFNTANVTDMFNMFQNCSGLTSLDVSSFNTANVTDMIGMFNNCSGLTSLDVSSFNTANVTDMSYMFSYCINLVTIYAGDGWSTASLTNLNNQMFSGCESLVGGQGMTYRSNCTSAHFAHIDGGPGNWGYFTAKSGGLRGDVNGVGGVDMDDLTALINYLLTSNSTGINLANAAICDSPSSTTVDMDDLTALINYLLDNTWP